MTDLLPCPFCNGLANASTRMDEDLATHNIVPWHRVGCPECEVYFELPLGYDTDPYEQWNKRASFTTAQRLEGE